MGNFCSNCGNKLNEGANFCNHCGSKVFENQHQDNSLTSNQPNTSNPFFNHTPPNFNYPQPGVNQPYNPFPVSNNINDRGISNSNLEQIIKLAELALADGEYFKATGFCDQALYINAENPKAYLIKLLAQYWVKSLKELGESYKDFESSSNYKALLRFGDERLKAELTNYINQAKSIWKYISIVVLMFISTIIVTLVVPRLVNISEGVIGLILMLILGSFYNYLCLSKLNESINKALNIRLYKCYFAIFLISLFIIPQFSVIILFWILLFHVVSSFLAKEYYLLKNPFISNEILTEFSNEVLTTKDVFKIIFTNNSNRCSKDKFILFCSLELFIVIILFLIIILFILGFKGI